MIKKQPILLLFLCITMLFTSCEKDKIHWEKYFGYTREDVVGHYESIDDESYYGDLPTELVDLYNNVTLDIQAGDGNTARVHIVIPDKLNRWFSGVVPQNDDDFIIDMSGFDNYDFLATVYKSQDGTIRLHGRVNKYTSYQANVCYGFDVIKKIE